MYLTAALISQVSAFPLAESSGDSDDLFETSQVLREPNLEFLALHIRSVAVELRDRQLCDFFSLCDGSMSSLQMYNMQLPQLTQGDRCYRRSFRKKTCLTKIVKSLYEYKSYLQFVKQGTENEKHQVDSMLMSMENLADLLQVKTTMIIFLQLINLLYKVFSQLIFTSAVMPKAEPPSKNKGECQTILFEITSQYWNLDLW
ncbi:interleukin-6-like [Hemitrygon akajei]|uniref:interleukin-6-like n=1 Tax=Hemitrygon akajei TaxID=2704970 RepID=UPI003BF95FDF